MRETELLVVFACVAYGLGVTFLLLRQDHLSFWERALYFLLSPVLLPLMLIVALGLNLLSHENIDEDL